MSLSVSLLLPIAPAFLAEMEKSNFDFSLLFNYGVCGLILAWTLWKAEPRLRAIERAIDRLTMMIAVMLTELPHVFDAAKAQAVAMVEQLKDAARDRGDRPKPE